MNELDKIILAHAEKMTSEQIMNLLKERDSTFAAITQAECSMKVLETVLDRLFEIELPKLKPSDSSENYGFWREIDAIQDIYNVYCERIKEDIEDAEQSSQPLITE